jgi:hypothetical protein
MAERSLDRPVGTPDATGVREEGLRATAAAAAGQAAGLTIRGASLVARAGIGAGERVLAATEEALGATIIAVLDSSRTERLLRRALAQPSLQRLVDDVIGSELSQHTVDRLLSSDELDRLVTAVAGSPQIREALAVQSANLANEVGSAVRTRAAAADSLAERVARRLIGRRASGAGEGDVDADDDGE